MSQPMLFEGNPPGPSDPGGAPSTGPNANSLVPQEIDSRSRENVQTGRDRGTRRVGQEAASDDSGSRFCAAFAPVLRDVVRRRRGSALDPEDAAQEAWLVLVARVAADRAGDGGDDLPAQLVVMIRNHLADLRRRSRRRLCHLLTEEAADSLVGRELDPADFHEICQVREEVRAVLIEARERIPGPSHRIVILRWIEGRTFAEIAEILGMTVGRVRDRHRRALPVLRALLIRRFGADLSVLPAARPDADLRTPEFEEVTP